MKLLIGEQAGAFSLEIQGKKGSYKTFDQEDDIVGELSAWFLEQMGIENEIIEEY